MQNIVELHSNVNYNFINRSHKAARTIEVVIKENNILCMNLFFTKLKINGVGVWKIIKLN